MWHSNHGINAVANDPTRPGKPYFLFSNLSSQNRQPHSPETLLAYLQREAQMTTLVKKIHEFSPPMTNDARSAQ